MSGRESLLAELEAKRREQAEKTAEGHDSGLASDVDDAGYDPYDNPGHAKPLNVDQRMTKPGLFRRR